MNHPYLNRRVDEAEDIPAEVEIDEVQVRMECLRLAAAKCEGFNIIETASVYAAFVIHGTVPTTN